ncbi:BOLA class I histocompatibility antigen, alpha chain BL3-7-like [Labeo rohita]|uniref:BOLA class I histocompatibility antigen, alpha chain BL3-7-like n=1 Tax=Labeo rohita TaxID=84645 RepID=UPI0021E2383E|nr:BOLA class I histocompatibility antigen, alpha chain BL3-7-like [Labeo rohita]
MSFRRELVVRLIFSKGVYEYGYDGENFMSFDNKEYQWVASVDAALPTKRKWDNGTILNQYCKSYLEKDCVDWLNKFREYDDWELRNNPPDVHIVAKRSRSDRSMQKLTCLTTGVYPKDSRLFIRKYHTSLPEDEVESTGVRPNHDGNFQLRKSAGIEEDAEAEYDCFVTDRTLREPLIIKYYK